MHYHLNNFFAPLSYGIIAVAMNRVRLRELSQFSFHSTGWQVSSLCWISIKRGLPRSRVRGHCTDQNFLLCEGWGPFPTLWDPCSTFTCLLLHFAPSISLPKEHTITAVGFWHGLGTSLIVGQLSWVDFSKSCERWDPACRGEAWLSPNDHFWRSRHEWLSAS